MIKSLNQLSKLNIKFQFFLHGPFLLLRIPLQILQRPHLILDQLFQLMLSDPLSLMNSFLENEDISFVDWVDVQLLFDVVFDFLVVEHVVLVHNRNCSSRFACSCRSPHPMDVVLETLRDIEINDQVHIWNIQSSTRDICGH